MSESFKFRDYVDAVGEGDITRSEAAKLMGVNKSTARYHLEKAVEHGMLERIKLVIDDSQVGYVYRKKGVQPLLPFEGEVEQEPDLLDQLFEDGTSALDLDTWEEYPPATQWPSEQTVISQWEYDVEAAQNHGDLGDM